MKKILILIPVYNDWESLKKLLIEINDNITAIENVSINCLVINDASTISQPKLTKPDNFKSLQINVKFFLTSISLSSTLKLQLSELYGDLEKPPFLVKNP